ncbi:MAG: hypothetical protein AABZ74_00530 [Cyanobacteriota bacterium]
MKKYVLKTIALALTTSVLTSCSEGLVIAPTSDGGILFKTQKSIPPAIKSFDFYPKSTSKKDDVITFTINASSKNNDPLQYTWKASKGTLLTNSGNTVSWKPLNQDNTYESGIGTITVTVSDGKYTVDGSANVFINADGTISENKDSVKISTTSPDTSSDKGVGLYFKLVDPEQDVQPKDVYVYEKPEIQSNSSTYNYNYSYSSTTSNSNTTINQSVEKYYNESDIGDDNDYYSKIVKVKPKYSKFIFQDDFESGYIDDDWNISSSNSRYSKNYLTWKKLKDSNGNHVAVLTGPTDRILNNTYASEVMMTSSAVDLRVIKLPRMSLYAKNASNPSSSVKINIYWSKDGVNLKPLNVSFIPDQKWKKLDIDLNNLLRSYSPNVGFITIGVKVSGNKNDFTGPMIDNIMIYDSNNY